MSYQPTQSFRGPRFSAEQRRLLDAIGAALKGGRLSFAAAGALGEQVKAGRLAEVAEALEHLPAED